MARRKVVFAHDIDPDFSRLDQDCYNPSSKDYDPVYPSRAEHEQTEFPLTPGQILAVL